MNDNDLGVEIVGPDEEDLVWLKVTDAQGMLAIKLGPKCDVVELLSQWLGSVDADECEGRG